MHPSTLLVCLALVMACPAQAETLEVPLEIDNRHVRQQVAGALGMDQAGRARLVSDPCNRVALSDLRLLTLERRLQLSVAVAADAGAHAFGNCIGPVHWQGRMRLELIPSVDESGHVVVLSPASVELRRPDGTPGVFTRPVRVLAEKLVLPRLADARLNLRAHLADLDRLVRELLPATAEAAPLVERARLTGVAVDDHGLYARLGFDVRPPAEPAAAPEPALDEAELARWRRLEDGLDGFLTTIIARLAAQAPEDDLRIEMLGVLLDSRLAIAQALAAPEPGDRDPVRELFVESWDRLRPHLVALERAGAAPDDTSLRLAAFTAGADMIRALDALGPEYDLEISRDGLRRMARMLLADEAPASFTPLPLEVDPGLRGLFGFAATEAPSETTARWWQWPLPAAHASADSPGEALRGLVPRLAILDDYLGLVSTLLEQEANARLAGETRVPGKHHSRIDPLVRATAWKETCWRHYVGATDQPRVIRSPVGAVGMMQINGRVWRGVYDLDRLEDDVRYNVAAGIEILEHYFVDYAIRRGEHERPGGNDNLVRATYSAYNGGPSQLSRYRREDFPARLRAIDREFWKHYEQMNDERWPDVGSCYPV